MNAIKPEIAMKNPKRYSFAPVRDCLTHQFVLISAGEYANVHFDLYCPLFKTNWNKESTQNINITGPPKLHMKCHKFPAATLATSAEEEEEEENQLKIFAREERMSVFDNIFDVFLSPFNEDTAKL